MCTLDFSPNLFTVLL